LAEFESYLDALEEYDSKTVTQLSQEAEAKEELRVKGNLKNAVSNAGLRLSYQAGEEEGEEEEEGFDPFAFTSKIKKTEGLGDSSIVNKILRDLDGKKGRFFTEKEVEFFQGLTFIGNLRYSMQQLVRTVEAIKKDEEYNKLSSELKLDYAIQKMKDGKIITSVGSDFGSSVKDKIDDIVLKTYTEYFTNTPKEVAIDLIRTIINRLITNKSYSVQIPDNILTSVLIMYLVPFV